MYSEKGQLTLSRHEPELSCEIRGFRSTGYFIRLLTLLTVQSMFDEFPFV